MKEIYIKCPKCDLNYITKKEKICSVCKQKAATTAKNLLDSEKVAETGLCPICKINYITEDETVCGNCYEESELSDEEIAAKYGHKAEEGEEGDMDEDGLSVVDDDEMDLPEGEDLALLAVAGIDADESEEEDMEEEYVDDPLDDLDDSIDEDLDLDEDDEDDGDDD